MSEAFLPPRPCKLTEPAHTGLQRVIVGDGVRPALVLLTCDSSDPWRPGCCTEEGSIDFVRFRNGAKVSHAKFVGLTDDGFELDWIVANDLGEECVYLAILGPRVKP